MRASRAPHVHLVRTSHEPSVYTSLAIRAHLRVSACVPYMYDECLMRDMCVASCRPHIAHVAQSRVHLMCIPCATRVCPARTFRRLACQRVQFVCLMCALLPPVLRADLRHAPTCVSCLLVPCPILHNTAPRVMSRLFGIPRLASCCASTRIARWRMARRMARCTVSSAILRCAPYF